MKHIKQQNKRVSPSPQKGVITERSLFRLMLPSLLGILLCSTCLAGLTWAYFSDSVTSSANTITAATFTVDVTITEITEAETGSEGSLTTTAEAGSASTLMNGNSVNEAGGQEENTPSRTSPANASNTAANAEGNTLTANVLSVGTTDPSTDTPANEEGGTDTGTVTQPGGTTTGEGSTSEEGTSGGGSDPENKAAGEGSTTGEGSTSAEGTPEAGSEPENEAAGEGTLAAANSPNTESETDPPTPTPNTTTTVERNADGSYTLTAGKKYTVTLTASGTATGYCNISFGDKEYHTVALAPNETISFTVCASEAYTSLTIAPQWGTYHAPVGGTDTAQIGNNGSIGTSTTDAKAAEQADSPAVTEPAAAPDEPLSEETVQSNEQTPVEPTPAEPTPSEETTTADEPTDTPSEGQSEE